MEKRINTNNRICKFRKVNPFSTLEIKTILVIKDQLFQYQNAFVQCKRVLLSRLHCNFLLLTSRSQDPPYITNLQS